MFLTTHLMSSSDFAVDSVLPDAILDLILRYLIKYKDTHTNEASLTVGKTYVEIEYGLGGFERDQIVAGPFRYLGRCLSNLNKRYRRAPANYILAFTSSRGIEWMTTDYVNSITVYGEIKEYVEPRIYIDERSYRDVWLGEKKKGKTDDS